MAGRMTDAVTSSPDAWLAGLLGKPCFHLSGALAGLDPADVPAGPCFVGAKAAADDAPALLRLQQLGFRVVDVNLQLVRPAEPLVMAAGTAGGVRFASPGDEPGVRALARAAFEHNRFHRDPEVGPELAGRIKEEWAANFFAGRRGDWMIVAEATAQAAPGTGAVAGFLQLLSGPGGALVIDLVAVDAAWRGRGLARAMIAQALGACRTQPPPMRVGTQLGNAASLRLYAGLGFRHESASYVLHLHKKGA
ncbi:GNAT family N-acetyltransferase [Humidesulfovibrio idahonensis]